ncbi:P-loop containing nucleoside triphosphate hydrolase protein, partial [Glomus cerebriforme]
SEEKKIHLKHLIRFLEQEYYETIKNRKKMIANKSVSFDMLWVFYTVNLEVWYKCSISKQQIGGIISSIDTVFNDKDKLVFRITIKIIDYDGRGFKYCYVERRIEYYDGEMSFSDLPVVPFRFSNTHDSIRNIIHGNGKKFFDLARGRNFMKYEGPLLRWRIVNGCKEVEMIKADGRVMIDLMGFAIMNPNYPMDTAKPPNPSKPLDPIVNKGKGCIILCYGPPGTGKTLTAESVAEFLERPLWMISVHELGTDPAKLEQKLIKVLDIAFTWRAVLLLDEADIYFEERNSDVNRNTLTGIFLRQLEYYQGILFLTTNRIKAFDNAFCSRINMFFHYPELNLEKRREIWKNFISHASLNLDEDDFSEYKLNGREIRNILRTAQAFADSRNEYITKEHVIKVIKMFQEFQKDVKKMGSCDQDCLEILGDDEKF